jgi:hypothetical protein
VHPGRINLKNCFKKQQSDTRRKRLRCASDIRQSSIFNLQYSILPLSSVMKSPKWQY